MSLCRAFLWPGDSAVVWSVGAASVQAGVQAAQYFQTGRSCLSWGLATRTPQRGTKRAAWGFPSSEKHGRTLLGF